MYCRRCNVARSIVARCTVWIPRLKTAHPCCMSCKTCMPPTPCTIGYVVYRECRRLHQLLSSVSLYVTTCRCNISQPTRCACAQCHQVARVPPVRSVTKQPAPRIRFNSQQLPLTQHWLNTKIANCHRNNKTPFLYYSSRC